MTVAVRDVAPGRRAGVEALVRELDAVLASADDDAALIVCAPDVDAFPTGVPTLTYGIPTPPDGGFGLPAPDDTLAFVAALAPWLDRGTAFARITALFGDAAMEPMAGRLVEDIERFLHVDRCDPFAWHALAGFAGTLGFRRYAFCLERLSRQDESFRRAADREAGWALVTLRAYLQKQRDLSTLV